MSSFKDLLGISEAIEGNKMWAIWPIEDPQRTAASSQSTYKGKNPDKIRDSHLTKQCAVIEGSYFRKATALDQPFQLKVEYDQYGEVTTAVKYTNFKGDRTCWHGGFGIKRNEDLGDYVCDGRLSAAVMSLQLCFHFLGPPHSDILRILNAGSLLSHVYLKSLLPECVLVVVLLHALYFFVSFVPYLDANLHHDLTYCIYFQILNLIFFPVRDFFGRAPRQTTRAAASTDPTVP